MKDIEHALATVNRSLGDFKRVLDFGCGCGRVLSWMANRISRDRLFGVDIDHKAIDWLRDNLPGMKLYASDHNPPLPFESGYFDFVYCHSVFTHLDVVYQDAWLEELLRVTAPGSVLLISFSGSHSFEKLKEAWEAAGASPAALREKFLSEGHLFIEDDEWKNGPFPDFYHSMFHTTNYVYRHWGRWFRTLAHIPQGSLGYQDFVVLEHPPLDSVNGTAPEGRKAIPLPPESLRFLVGPTDDAAYDNEIGVPVFPEIPERLYEAVFDFGCGCGRTARQLLQQKARPRRYVGIDIHQGMIDWCNENLAPFDRNFRFLHHDVFNIGLAPNNSRQFTLPYPAADREFTLVNAHSVFTHLLKEQTEFYLSEIARVLTVDGIARTTWFFFDREALPFLVEGQVCLFVNEMDPSNAVIYDRKWFLASIRKAGLAVLKTVEPAVPGHQWEIFLGLRHEGSLDDFPTGEQVLSLYVEPDKTPRSPAQTDNLLVEPTTLRQSLTRWILRTINWSCLQL
jgi:SAM-dependent methyltransferase